MTERVDPGRTGVRAGRVVGVLTAVLVVVSLLRVRGSFVGRLESLVGLLGVDPGPSVSVYFVLYVAGAAVARYGLCYVVGSLVGVVYDWLDSESTLVLAALVVPIGLVDGVVAVLDTGSLLTGAGYTLAWLCFLPAFVYYRRDEPDRREPVRFDDR